jgi:chemosensory pili system protein ChpA (sensor histidine kinase/response regulator)
MSEHDVLDLLFLPGFSTAPTVTTAAGRGVGMDVVRTNVGRLGGEIDVQTEVGAGTRFTLKLPLTVAIADALLARIGTETLAIPVPAVKAMVRVRPDEIQGAGGVETVEVEGQRLDVVRLDRILGLTSLHPGGPLPIVALRTGRKTLAVVVDELLGKEEIVIKRLGAFLEGVGYFSGATVSGDGRVILLLDPVRLLEAGGGAEATRSAAVTVDSPPAVASRAPQAARSVLLVDDSVSVRKFVGQMLERAGFQVVTANDGAEALHLLGDDLVVKVVVTDLEMPRLNGYELIRDLKRRPATRDLPIVVLTTRAGEKHVGLARQLGVQHYVTKPVDEQAFVQLIDALTATETAGVAV